MAFLIGTFIRDCFTCLVARCWWGLALIQVASPKAWGWSDLQSEPERLVVGAGAVRQQQAYRGLGDTKDRAVPLRMRSAATRRPGGFCTGCGMLIAFSSLNPSTDLWFPMFFLDIYSVCMLVREREVPVSKVCQHGEAIYYSTRVLCSALQSGKVKYRCCGL